MKYLFFVFFSLSVLPLYGQEETACQILKSFFKDKNVEEVFGFDTYKDVPIIIVDKRMRFNGCFIGNQYGRKVEIITDTTSQDVINPSNIIIYDLLKIGKQYKINVYFKLRQAYGDIYFKRKGNRYVVSKFSVGNF